MQHPAKRFFFRFNQKKHSLLDNINNTLDTIYDSPLITAINPAIQVRTIRKEMFDRNFARSLAVGTPLSQGSSFNNGSSKGLLDYFDINGDRYPDIIGSENYQYTLPQGGLEQNVTNSANTFRYSEFTGNGISYGVQLPVSKQQHSHDPKSNSAENKIITDVKTKKCSISGGAAYYSTDSHLNEALIDINGDGLPDKFDKNSGKIRLNIGYGFETAEDWGIADINNGISQSISSSLGYSSITEFNKLEYSWSAGINGGESFNKNSLILCDMNADGLQDIVYVNSVNNNLYVRFNNGNGFAPTTNWSDSSKIQNSKNINASAYLSGTFGFTRIIPLPKIRVPIQ